MRVVIAVLALAGASILIAAPQGLGSAGAISGTVTDPSGATIAGAAVEVQNPVTGYDKSVTADASGAFRFTDVAPGNYRVTVAVPDSRPTWTMSRCAPACP